MDTKPSLNHYENRMQYLRDKFSVQALELDNEIVIPKKTSLAEFVENVERKRAEESNMKIAVGHISYRKRPMKLWYTLSN